MNKWTVFTKQGDDQETKVLGAISWKDFEVSECCNSKGY